MKKALITGVAGQDGSYLADLLLPMGYAVFGLAKESSDDKHVPEGVTLLRGDLTDTDTVKHLVQTAQPDEVYNLASVTDLKTAYSYPELTHDIIYSSVGVLLDECLKANPSVRFLQASSSEIFLPANHPLDENAARDWETDNPYAQAKMQADRDFIEAPRKEKNAFTCSAFLFNHESPRRSEKRALRKITSTLAKIHAGKASTLSIGNVDMVRDWGFAGDYVRAMHAMLQQDTPQDFVIASGERHTVKEAIALTAQYLGMELTWEGTGLETKAFDQSGKKVVETVAEFYKELEPMPKVGNIAKAETILGWKPSVRFESLIEMMVAAEQEQLRTET